MPGRQTIGRTQSHTPREATSLRPRTSQTGWRAGFLSGRDPATLVDKGQSLKRQADESIYETVAEAEDVHSSPQPTLVWNTLQRWFQSPLGG